MIEEGRTTIASLLRDTGYATAMVGKWHLGFAENGYDKPLPGGPRLPKLLRHPRFTDEAVPIIRNHDTAQLDDLEKDPAETTNLFNEHPGTVECLRGELRRIIAAEDSAAR